MLLVQCTHSFCGKGKKNGLTFLIKEDFNFLWEWYIERKESRILLLNEQVLDLLVMMVEDGADLGREMIQMSHLTLI